MKKICVEVKPELIAKVESYVQREPGLYKSVEQFVEWAIENDLNACLDIEDEKLSGAVWEYQKENKPLPSELQKKIGAFIKAARAEHHFSSGCDTVRGWIAHTRKYNREFKEAREVKELEDHRILVAAGRLYFDQHGNGVCDFKEMRTPGA